MKRKWHAILPFVVILVAVFLVYFNVLRGPFLYDDISLVKLNRTIQSFSNIVEWFTTSPFHFKGIETNLYRPIPTTFNAILYALFGVKSTVPFHVLNVLFHFGSAALFFTILKKLDITATFALLGALIFAVHPVNTESVSYIAGLPDVASGFFMLSGIALSMHIFSEHNLRHKTLLFFGVTITYIAALLSKESAISFALLILLILVFGWKKLNTQNKTNAKQLMTLVLSLSVIYITAKMTILQFVDGKQGLMSGLEYTTDITLRIYTFLGVIHEYIKLIFFPKDLFFDKPLAFSVTIISPKVLMGIVYLIIAGVASSISFRRRKFIFLGVFWFFISLAPVSGILIPSNAVFTEHWLYIPIIGAISAVVAYADKIRFRRSIISFFICMILILGGRTILRNREWADPWRFFQNEIEHSKGPRPFVKMADLLAEKGEYERVIQMLNIALDSNIFIREAYNNLGDAYIKTKQYDLALKVLLKGIMLAPTFQKQYFTLFQLFEDLGMATESEIVAKYIVLSQSKKLSEQDAIKMIEELKLSATSSVTK